MNCTIFLGPSLPRSEAEQHLQADYCPPVSQGDVYRAVTAGAQIIGIIDGYFERVPAVWHKEILWAMSQGVHVFGASSMGALRAAELHSYGMTGIGRVFEAFRDNELEDDDEVTITHGPGELGYPATSDAMVNIRATLADAETQGIIDAATHLYLIEQAKRRYYPERRYQDILNTAKANTAYAKQAAELEQWLATGRRDVKKEDAITLLLRIKADIEDVPGAKQVSFQFEATDAWEQASRRVGRQIAASIPDDLPMDMVLEELRLDGEAYRKTIGVALSRALALREAENQGATIDRERFRAVLNNFFIQRGLTRPEDISGWMADQDVDANGLTELIQRELKVGLVETLFRDNILAQVPDSLRVGGIYGSVVKRVQVKQQWLAEFGYENISVDACGIDEEALLQWYFQDRLGRETPADMDGYAQSLGLGNRFDFLQAVAREYLFCHRQTDSTEQSIS